MLSIIFILNLLLNTGVFTVHSASDMHHKTSEENVKKSIQKNDRNLSYLNTNPVSNSRITNMSDKYTELQNQKLIFLYTMNTQTSDEFYFDYPNINKVIIEGVLQRLRNSPVSDNTSAFYSSFSKDRLIKRSVLTSDYVSSTTAASVSGSTSSSLLPSTLPPSTITAYDIDFVRVKIQGIIFDVKFQRPDYKSNGGLHLRNLMKPFQHLLLDPQYTEQVITTYNPLVMQNEICKEFENNQSDQHVTNTFFIVNDVGALVDRPMQDRLHRLFFQITSALGIPSITWLPTRVGQFEASEHICTLFLPL
ncbi:unnamed protein product [Trichobilharzia regenti]|nr:unnamed protein product [Trichobilharzia regenti]